jgi:nickel-dependent lactate racemase
VEVEVHEPGDPDALCYLASNEENHAIYLNRRIVEADFVLPIGPVRLESSFAYFGTWEGLFPAFADLATRERYQTPGALQRAASGALSHEAEEAAWLLGVQFLVQVIPGPGDRVLQVLAGSGKAVRERGKQICEDFWRRPVPRRANLVVAAISGGPDQQTWENFGRALYAAAQAVADNGVIALCTELRRPPGPAMQRLAGQVDSPASRRAVNRGAAFDAQSASLLSKLLEKKRIYLLSGLDGEIVEEIGLAHVASEKEIQWASPTFRVARW